MDNDKEIQELKERLASAESQLQRKSGFSGFQRVIVIFIVAVVSLMAIIGIIQFLSNPST